MLAVETSSYGEPKTLNDVIVLFSQVIYVTTLGAQQVLILPTNIVLPVIFVSEQELWKKLRIFHAMTNM